MPDATLQGPGNAGASQPFAPNARSIPGPPTEKTAERANAASLILGLAASDRSPGAMYMAWIQSCPFSKEATYGRSEARTLRIWVCCATA